MKFVSRIRIREDEFNNDLFLNIFKYLKPKSIIILGRVSQSWRKLTSNETIWCEICKREKIKNSEGSWLLSYVLTNKCDYYFGEKGNKEAIFYSKTIETIYGTTIVKGHHEIKIRFVEAGSMAHFSIGVAKVGVVEKYYIGSSKDAWTLSLKVDRFRERKITPYGSEDRILKSGRYRAFE